MVNFLRRTAQVAACTVLLAGPASAQVIDFEGINCNNVPGNVGTISGVTFSSNYTCYSFAQPPYTPSSGTNRVYTSASTAGSFSFAPAQFFGAYFSGSADVFFQVFSSSVLVATSSVLTTTSTPTFLSSGYGGNADLVTVTGSSLNFVMDDVTFGPSVVATPEPASVLLMGTGLVGLFAVSRRKRA